MKAVGFHKTEANPLLVKWFKELSLEQDSRVFLSLCGKTLDIAWLLSIAAEIRRLTSMEDTHVIHIRIT